MRDYSNGGFFFIDAAPIQAAGNAGLKIEGIFEDAKRAIAGGKVFVLTGLVISNVPMSGVVFSAIGGETTIGGTVTELTLTFQITNEDVIRINIGG